MICTRPNTATSEAPSWLGEPCPDCGHTSLAHPGITNLTLDACLVCEVQATVQGIREAAQVNTAQTVELLRRQDAQLAELRARVDALEAPAVLEEGQ